MIEKILERLKAVGWVFAEYFPDETAIHRVTKKSIPYDEVVKIVQEVAKDGGWIPCSERLPEMQGNYYVTRKNGDVDIAGFLVWANGGFFNSYDNLDKFPDRKVIAWMPLPPKYEPKDAPYQKGE